jgi:hypothetical protein
MWTVVPIVLASVVSLMWVGPWLVVLIGGRLFLGLVAGLAVLCIALQLWLWLLPLAFALIGASIAASWWASR